MRLLLAPLALLCIYTGIAFGQTPAPSASAASPAAANLSFTELLDRLDAEIADDFGGKLSSGPNGRRVIQLATQLQSGIARGEYENSRMTLAELLDAMPTPQGKQIVIQLQQALPGEIEARKNAIAAQVAALRDKAARVCIDSKKEIDLEPILDEIDAMQLTLAAQWDPRQQDKVRAAREFLEQWQKYVAEDAAGFQLAALATLRSIRDNPTPYPLVPLSSIDSKIDLLAQAEPSERARKILDGLKTLDDLPAAIEALKAIPLQNSQESPALAIIDQLTRLELGAAALKSGDYAAALAAAVSAPPAFDVPDGGDKGVPRQWISSAVLDSKYADPSVQPVIFRLRQQLLTALLPAYLALPENPQPKPDENPEQYLLRVAGDAVARADYGEVSQILSAYRLCVFDGFAPPWLDAGIAGSTAYFQGQKLEQANSFAAAIAAYNRVLAQAPSRFNPAAQAVARIAALHKDHPADFDKAANSLSQPAPPATPGGG